MDFNILDYGARADGTVCTANIQAAIDAAGVSGGRIIIPEGTFVSGTLRLRSGVEIHLERGAVLKGSTDMSDYNELDEYEQNFSSPKIEGWLGKHLIIALYCEDVALSGEGTLDGSGDFFFAEPVTESIYVWHRGYCYPRDMELLRPGQLVCFIECKRVRCEGINLTNQPCWGLYFHGCDDVFIKGINVNNPKCFPNTDGIDIDSCYNAVVSDCTIHTGDDAIAIRASQKRLKNKEHHCENITVTNCKISSASSAIRIGVGDGLIKDVRISDIEISCGAPALCFVSCYSGKSGVSIEDVVISNVKATETTRPIHITEGIGVLMRNILIENFDVETYGYCDIGAQNLGSLSDLTLKNWRVTLTESPEPITERDAELHGDVWMRVKNVERLKIDGFKVVDPHGYLDAWSGGAFSFDGCDDRECARVEIQK